MSYPWETETASDRSGVFKAELDIAGLASEVGYHTEEYEVAGVEYEGDGNIRVHFRTVDTTNNSKTGTEQETRR
jgi:hypothetical protein